MSDPKHEVILVEDNRDDAELSMMALAKFMPREAILILRNGAQVLDYLFCRAEYAGRDEGDQPKLIILDLKLPKLSGIQVLEVLKNDARLRFIPVVVLTSSREHPDIHRCLDLGANSYVVKPIDVVKFSEVIRDIGLYWIHLNQNSF